MLFDACDLDLDLMTLVLTLDLVMVMTYLHAKNEANRQRIQSLFPGITDRHTDICVKPF